MSLSYNPSNQGLKPRDICFCVILYTVFILQSIKPRVETQAQFESGERLLRVFILQSIKPRVETAI